MQRTVFLPLHLILKSESHIRPVKRLSYSGTLEVGVNWYCAWWVIGKIWKACCWTSKTQIISPTPTYIHSDCFSFKATFPPSCMIQFSSVWVQHTEKKQMRAIQNQTVSAVFGGIILTDCSVNPFSSQVNLEYTFRLFWTKIVDLKGSVEHSPDKQLNIWSGLKSLSQSKSAWARVHFVGSVKNSFWISKTSKEFETLNMSEYKAEQKQKWAALAHEGFNCTKSLNLIQMHKKRPYL